MKIEILAKDELSEVFLFVLVMVHQSCGLILFGVEMNREVSFDGVFWVFSVFHMDSWTGSLHDGHVVE